MLVNCNHDDDDVDDGADDDNDSNNGETAKMTKMAVINDGNHNDNLIRIAIMRLIIVRVMMIIMVMMMMMKITAVNSAHAFPASFRRRFSQGAIEPIRDLLQEMEDTGEIADKEDPEPQVGVREEKENKDRRESAAAASFSCFSEQLVLRGGGKEVPASRSWKKLKSLTGTNISGWKYQVRVPVRDVEEEEEEEKGKHL